VLFEGRAYRAGPGVAISGEDLMELALRQSGTNAPQIAPIEATAAAAMALLRETGAVTIPVSGMPGSACVYRLMMFPDGERLGAKPIVDGTRNAIAEVARLVSDPDATRRLLLGEG
jgi:L-seryl-tRNA(Ser) seleniumtransferase